MRKLSFFILFVAIYTNLTAQKINYPICPQQTVVDTFFNQYIISDYYRNLENTNSNTVKKWLNAENKLSKKYLNKLTNKYSSKTLIDKYSYIVSEHIKQRGKYFFSFKIRNKFENPSLYIGETADDVHQVLINPNRNNSGDRITITDYSISKNSKYLAYQISRNGSDWKEIKVVNTPSGIALKDHLKNVKFSRIIWRKNGFYYSKYPKKKELDITTGEEIYYHKIGDKQTDDKLIFKRKNPNIKFTYNITSDERFFVIKEQVSNYSNIFFIDYNAEKPYLRPLLMKHKSDLSIIGDNDNKLIAFSLKNSNGGTLVAIDPYHPHQWKQIVPPMFNGVLIRSVALDNCICAIYQSNQHPILKVYNYSGEKLYQLKLPNGSSLKIIDYQKNNPEIKFTLEQSTIPPLTYFFNTKTFKRRHGNPVKVTFNFKNYENKQLYCPINDSIKIPINIVYKKGLKLNGNNPCLLKTYGGFGVISKPHFDAGVVYFIEKGGVFAFANIRGGGDFGKTWMKAGRRLNKQNSIDDFNSAAKFLIEKGYTNNKKLASMGGSHGGLIVAAAAIQQPNLYAVVIPKVGVMDMLRYEKFSVGNLLTHEFGTIKNITDFKNILSYSPLHNIKKSVNYPAMLVITSENDNRVPPFNSYKFVATLQNREAQTNPILLRIEKKAGHNGAMYRYARNKETADIYAFILHITK